MLRNFFFPGQIFTLKYDQILSSNSSDIQLTNKTQKKKYFQYLKSKYYLDHGMINVSLGYSKKEKSQNKYITIFFIHETKIQIRTHFLLIRPTKFL